MKRNALLFSSVIILAISAFATTGHTAGSLDLLKSGSDQEKQYALLHMWDLKFSERNCDDFKPVIEALSDKSPQVRETAASFLGQLGEQSAAICRNAVAPALLKALKDPDHFVREAAARAVINYAVEAVAPLSELLQDTDPWVRLSAAYALGKQRNSRAAGALLPVFDDDSDWRYKFVQQESVIALSRSKINYNPEFYKFWKGQASPEQVKQLRETGHATGLVIDFDSIEYILAAASDEEVKDKIIAAYIRKASDPYLRRMVLEEIGVYGIREAREVVRQAADDKDEIIKSTAIEALGRLDRTPPGIVPQPLFYASGPKPAASDTRVSSKAYETSLKDPSPSVRAAAAAGLGSIDDPSAVDLLAAAIRDSSPEVRAKAAGSLGRLTGQKKAYDILAGAVGDENKKVKLEVVVSLGKFSKEPLSVDPLLSALNDNDKQIKKAAIWALRSFSDVRILRALAPCLSVPDLREHAKAAFSEVAGKGGKGIVHIYRKDGIRRVVKEYTGTKDYEGARIVHPAAVGVLIDAFHSSRSDVGIESFWLLAEFEDARIEKLLISYLKHPSRHMRTNTLIVIHSACGQRVVPHLIKAAQKNEFGERSFVIQALSHYQDDRALKTIIAGLHDDDRRVRVASAKALAHYSKPGAKEKIGGKTKETLIEFLKGPDTELVCAAAEALGVVGRQESVGPLLEVLKKYSAAAGCLTPTVAKALLCFRDERIIPVFIEVFKSLDSPAKEVCMRAFGSTKDNRAVPVLLEYITGYRSGKSNLLGGEAVMALGNIGDETAYAALVSLLDDPFYKQGARIAIDKMKGVAH